MICVVMCSLAYLLLVLLAQLVYREELQPKACLKFMMKRGLLGRGVKLGT